MRCPIKSRHGQALAELAVFGSIMLIVVAALVRNGLQNLYTQQTMQEGFRRSLLHAHERLASGQGSAQVVQDRYIPDPSRPFALGTAQTFLGTGGVTWSTELFMEHTRIRPSRLPETVLYLNDPNGTTPRTYKLANYMAYITPRPARGGVGAAFRRVAQIFCNDEANTDQEFNDCGTALNRGNRMVQNGFVSVPQPNAPALQIEVVGGAGVTGRRNTSIVVDACAGQLMDPQICKVQCDKMLGWYPRRPNGRYPPQRRPALPQPAYCAELGEPDPTQASGTRLRDRYVQSPFGLDFNNYLRNITATNRITALDPQRQTVEINQSETIRNRVIRTKVPGGSFDIQTEPLPYGKSKNEQQTWQTP